MSFDARNSKLTFSASDKGVAFTGGDGSSMNLGIGSEGVKIEGGGNNVKINAGGGMSARVNIEANDGLHSSTNIHAQGMVRSNLFGSYREVSDTPSVYDINVEADMRFNVQAKNAFNINGFDGAVSFSSYTFNNGTRDIIGLEITSQDNASFSANKIMINSYESFQINGNDIDFGYGGKVLYKEEATNEAGQVKVNYTGLDTTGFVADTLKILNIGLATPDLSLYPTTVFPKSTPNDYSGFFDSSRGELLSIGRLIENPIDGQVHTWRFQLSYSGKASGNNGSLDLILTNPVSGFTYVMPFTLPSGRTSGSLNSIAITIADNNSIIPPNGYILQAVSSFTDINLKLEINSITRISNGNEIH